MKEVLKSWYDYNNWNAVYLEKHTSRKYNSFRWKLSNHYNPAMCSVISLLLNKQRQCSFHKLHFFSTKLSHIFESPFFLFTQWSNIFMKRCHCLGCHKEILALAARWTNAIFKFECRFFCSIISFVALN